VTLIDIIMKNTREKLLILVFVSVFLVITLSFIVSADFWACFKKGEKINFCNPSIPDRTASSDGYILCMSNYNSTKSCFTPGNWNACNSASQECTYVNQEDSIDLEPPSMEIDSPLNGGIYNTISTLVKISTDERADLYYSDPKDSTRWIRLCQKCTSYNQKKIFIEGLNEVTFRAKDVNNNIIYQSISFTIDSKKPRIVKTSPKSGFISNEFQVQFTELNPSSLILSYGNNGTGYHTNSLDLSQCSLLPGNSGKYDCSISIDLDSYNNQDIAYWFNLTDIAGSSQSHRPIKLKVDTINPEINYFNYTLSGRKLSINMSVIEDNLDKIEYYDYSSSRPRWTTLCPSLRKGYCTKTINLVPGVHDLEIRAIDKAGNSDSADILAVV